MAREYVEKSEKYMSKEKYVKAIIKKIKCSSSKKKEIEKQLLSDISIALEEGEKIEDVIRSMGSVDEMSEEFNSNLSETEIKKYRFQKRIRICSVIALIIMILIAWIRWLFPISMAFGASGIFEEQVVKEQMKQVVLLINENDHEALLEMSIEEMKYVFNDNTLTQLKEMVSNDWGKFEEFGNMYLLEGKQKGQVFVIGQVTVSYENVTVTYQITLDKDLKLAGLYMR